LLVVGLAAVVALAGAGFAVCALTGGDAPPSPQLSGGSGAAGESAAGGRWRPARAAGAFVGYRVDEEYLGVGVRTAVGRTPAVTGGVDVAGGRVRRAALIADLRSLRSDQAQRDAALRTRTLETDRYPSARFVRARPFALRTTGQRAVGTLELHGRRAPIVAVVRGQRLADGRLELVGSAPIRFGAFAVSPPSVAGLVTVRDHGLLEFRLVLRRP
jgi:polyisoprenoid-binding protein YceI